MSTLYPFSFIGFPAFRCLFLLYGLQSIFFGRRFLLKTASIQAGERWCGLQSLQKQTKEQRTIALTVQEIRSMGKRRSPAILLCPPSECSTRRDYAVNGIPAKTEDSRLEEKLQSAQKSAAVWKQRYESLKEQVRPYLEAVKPAPFQVQAFLNVVLARIRQTRQHDQPSRRKSQDMELSWMAETA